MYNNILYRTIFLVNNFFLMSLNLSRCNHSPSALVLPLAVSGEGLSLWSLELPLKQL